MTVARGVYHIIDVDITGHKSREGRPNIDQLDHHQQNTVLVAYGYINEGKQDKTRILALHPSRLEKFEKLCEKHGLMNNGPAGLRHLSPPEVDYPFDKGVTYFEWEPLRQNPNTDVRENVSMDRVRKRHDEAGVFRTARMGEDGTLQTTAEYRGSWDDVTRHIQQKQSEGYKFIGSTEEQSPAIAAAIWQENARNKQHDHTRLPDKSREEFFDIDVER